MGWVLVPCLARLRDEFNRLAPSRAKGSDGSVGDLAHQDRTSDHNPDETGSVPIHDSDHVNEVHALDVTTDLREPGLTMEMAVQFLLSRCRAGSEKRLRYIIFNRRIWRADNGWRQEKYTGTSDPHTGHAHFSASYTTSLEGSTASWHLEDLVAVTDTDIAKIVKAVWAHTGLNPYTNKNISMEAYVRYAPSLATVVSGVDARLKARFEALAAGIAQNDVDEAAVAQAILAGMDYKQIAAAVVAALPPDQAEQVVNELSIRLSSTKG